MKLISLTCNQQSFKPLYFNSKGLSFIAGQQKNPDEVNQRMTYNGVGKSLSIYLIHFCLGASVNESLETALPKWEFELTFEINHIRYVSKRNTSTQTKIILNNEELQYKKFNDRLQELVFEIEEPVSGLKFRPLISRFIRPSRASYQDYASVRKTPPPYENLVINGFLLGLNVNLIKRKHDLKVQLDKALESKKRLSKEPIFTEYFTQDKNPDIELRDLQEEIERLEREIRDFQVAENYYDVERLANEKKQELQLLKNKAIVLENAIGNINISLEERPDISLQKVVNLYNSVSQKLSEKVVKELSEVTQFHENLVNNRIKRLASEKESLQTLLRQLNQEIETSSKEVDEFLTYLGTHGALDELVKLSSFVNDLKSKAQKIIDFKEFQNYYDNQIQITKNDMGIENARSSQYLTEVKELLDKNMDAFRMFSRRFYAKKPGGLTVQNNIGENKIRFSINAEIEDDASDGINEVKIFCFDMTILSRKQNHDINFLVHDSRLYSDMDPRQRATLFQIVHEYTKSHDAQYIATINQDQIDSVKELLSEDEFKDIFSNKNIILQLTDDDENGKLLGKQVNLKYE